MSDVQPIRLECPHCKTKLRLEPHLAGKRIRCPQSNCAKPISVPEDTSKSEPDSPEDFFAALERGEAQLPERRQKKKIQPSPTQYAEEGSPPQAKKDSTRAIAAFVCAIQQGNRTALLAALESIIACPDCSKTFRPANCIDLNRRRLECPHCHDFFIQW